jgi:23S rRNA pseudouridine955/2504/2580 synthase
VSEQPSSHLEYGPDHTVVRIGSLDADQRLDRFLRKLLPRATLGFLFKVIDRGQVRVNGRKSPPRRRLLAGDRVRIPLARGEMDRLGRPIPARPRGAADRAASLHVLHEDDHLLVVDKPSGQSTHGGAKSLTGAARDYLGSKPGALTFRVAPAHRLDKETSGVVTFGKTPAAQRHLTATFRERRAVKVYVALVAGAPARSGTLRSRLLRKNRPSGPKMSVDSGGVEAETRFVRLATNGEVSLLELRPVTGRTHQLRAQLADHGHPILGDRRYGGPDSRRPGSSLGLNRLFLHAARLEIVHPGTGRPRTMKARLPGDLRRVLRKLGFRPPGS